MSAKACGVPTAVSAAAMCAKACAVSAATMSAATMSAATVSAATVSAAAVSAATMSSAATAAAGVCFECEKRHDDEHHRGHASAGRQHQLHGAAALGAPHRRGQLSLAISPRTKSF